MLPQNINIEEAGNLLVFIITVGYQKQGESIVVLLKNRKNNEIVFSCVIDSFQRNKINKTIEILKDHNVEGLDILCWTHPDFDHSAGLEQIYRQFCTTDTKVIVPIVFWGNEYPVKAFNPNLREQKFYNELNEINKKTKSTFQPTGISPGGSQEIFKLNLQYGLDEIPVSLKAMSPFASQLKGIIDSYIENPKTNKAPQRNQVSVTLLLEIGTYKFFFGADIPNQEISLLDGSSLRDLIFVKIPHHGSKTSEKFLEYVPYGSNCLACTTVYKVSKLTGHLPHDKVISSYVENCEMVFSTGSREHNDYGIITAVFDLYETQSCSIYLEGSAELCK